jgi:STE20-related kinase adapter protein alpha
LKDTNDLLLLINEITRLKQLRHENIQQILNSFTKDTKLYCLYPLMIYGSCKDILELQDRDDDKSVFNEQSLQFISKSILTAIEYIHSKHVIHRCISPRNILISSNGHVVLSGFKYSVSLIEQGSLVRKLHDYPSSIKDYVSYLSPELLQQVGQWVVNKF